MFTFLVALLRKQVFSYCNGSRFHNYFYSIAGEGPRAHTRVALLTHIGKQTLAPFVSWCSVVAVTLPVTFKPGIPAANITAVHNKEKHLCNIPGVISGSRYCPILAHIQWLHCVLAFVVIYCSPQIQRYCAVHVHSCSVEHFSSLPSVFLLCREFFFFAEHFLLCRAFLCSAEHYSYLPCTFLLCRVLFRSTGHFSALLCTFLFCRVFFCSAVWLKCSVEKQKCSAEKTFGLQRRNMLRIEEKCSGKKTRRLDSHLIQRQRHDDYQPAYRPCHSTETALMKVHSDIMDALDNGCMVVLLMIDLSAPFDTLDYHTLLSRFSHSFGISGAALDWVKSYLTDRTQCVAVNSSSSEDAVLQFGVPQGSVLGLRKYCMYTKPGGSIVRRHGLNHHIFADDTQASPGLHGGIGWGTTVWRTTRTRLNISSSTKQRHLRPLDFSLRLSNGTFIPAYHVRNLGVVQDACLSMEKQVTAITRSCYHQIHLIGKVRRYLTTSTCKALVQSLVISRLDYANVLLYGLPQHLMSRLQRLQKKKKKKYSCKKNTAARLITCTPRRDHISPAMMSLHWLPTEYRPRYKILLHVCRALHDLSPPYIEDMVRRYKPLRPLRSSGQGLLVTPKTRTQYGRRSFRAAAPEPWNSLLWI